MDKEKMLAKANELMAMVENDNTITMWDLLAETSAEGFTMQEVYYLYMYLDKVWYGADHYWQSEDSNEQVCITPEI